MKIVCAHCQAEGKTGILGEMEPKEDPTVTYDICPEHRLRLEEEAGSATAVLPVEEHEARHAEARRYDRVQVALPVVGRAPQFLETALQGMARYVSEGGMMVEFPVEIVRGTVLRVILSTAQGPLEVTGEVVWATVHGGVVQHGLAFPEAKDPDFVVRVVGKAQR